MRRGWVGEGEGQSGWVRAGGRAGGDGWKRMEGVGWDVSGEMRVRGWPRVELVGVRAGLGWVARRGSGVGVGLWWLDDLHDWRAAVFRFRVCSPAEQCRDEMRIHRKDAGVDSAMLPASLLPWGWGWVGWDEMGLDGMGWDGMGWDEMK